jgi:hypothetical protein
MRNASRRRGSRGVGRVAELRPGVFEALFAKIVTEADTRTRMALEPLATAVERQAKINASNGRHTYGTPTPARPGEGPAVISGTLKGSVDHSPVTKDATGWMTKVGPRTGETPPYGGGSTQSHQYGYYLETGLKNGATYPWLKPAADYASKVAAVKLFTEKYGANWRRVI